MQPVVNISAPFPTQESDLQNYTQYADKISHVFVSYHLMINLTVTVYMADHEIVFQLTQDAQPHIFIPIASHRAETFILCAVR